jgi:hypothetical protein
MANAGGRLNAVADGRLRANADGRLRGCRIHEGGPSCGAAVSTGVSRVVQGPLG